MNLLTDLPTEEVVEARHRPVAAIAGGVAVLIVMLGTGLALVLSGGGADESNVAADEAAAEAEVEAETKAEVSLAQWLEGASDACASAIASNPALLATNGAQPAEIEDGVRTLADGLRALPAPTKAEEYSQAMSVIAVGELAEQAWGGAATVADENSNQAQVGNATALTHEFLDALVAAGATCPTG